MKRYYTKLLVATMAILPILLMNYCLTYAQAKPQAKPKVVQQAVANSYLPNFNERAIVKIYSYSGTRLENVNDDGLSTSELNTILPNISYGSGILISDNGTIVTAKHVVDEAEFFYVQVPSYSTFFPAVVVPTTNDSDYVFLQIRISNEKFRDYISLPTKTPSITRGETIFAYGFPEIPEEIEPNVSKGIISRYSNVLKMWQFDANVRGGSSGGPLVKENGQLIGIITSQLSNSESFNFAIGINHIVDSYRNLNVQNCFKNALDELNEMDSKTYQTRISLAKFFYQLALIENRGNLSESAYSTLKTDLRNIDSNLVPREWAILKKIGIYYNYGKIIDIIKTEGKDISTISELSSDKLDECKVYYQEFVNETLSYSSCPDSYTDVKELIYFTYALIVMKSALANEEDTGFNEYDGDYDESETSKIKDYIGRSLDDFNEAIGSTGEIIEFPGSSNVKQKMISYNENSLIVIVDNSIITGFGFMSNRCNVAIDGIICRSDYSKDDLVSLKGRNYKKDYELSSDDVEAIFWPGNYPYKIIYSISKTNNKISMIMLGKEE